MRGEASESASPRCSAGIIPAGTGRSHRRHHARLLAGDHPRGCGEKKEAFEKGVAGTGSSPRVRGEAEWSGVAFAKDGIIPAGAGRSASVVASARTRTDHPRGCGEKNDIAFVAETSAGSSPRVRGEVRDVVQVGTRRRIIPAGAGRSKFFSEWVAKGWDHPRECGEKRSFAAAHSASQGSSPRVRGEEDVCRAADCRHGIIPAGAGRRRPSCPW